ncbi:MAG: leucine-rich repeat protein, partial [Lachnospiraceae bacterium]|nr:leucine-rich repeat protein [Candidatus Colinaster equi]
VAECGPNQLERGWWGCINITGSCGDNCTYNIDGDTLYIDGPKDETTGSISDHAFYDGGAEHSKMPSEVKNIVVRGNITDIGRYAFDEAEYVENITLPEDLTSIGNNAFSGMSSLTGITIPSSIDFQLGFTGKYNTFLGVSNNIQIYCSEETCDRIEANRESFGLGSQILNIYTKDENGVYDVGGTLYSSTADMQTGTLSASCGDMATCLASIGTHCSAAEECQTLLDMSSEGTNCNSVSSCKTYLAEHSSGGEQTDSALIEKYNGTPLLYGKKIYTVQEAQEALSDGTKFHVGLTYK